MRRRYVTIFTTLVLVAVAFVLTVGSAAALPAYTTQTGQPCTTCHTTATGGPLTATGTAFAAGGHKWPIPAAAPAAAPAAPAAPAPAAPAAGSAPATSAPPALPSTGDAGAASQLPMALTFLSAAFAGLGLSIRRRR